MSLRRGEALTDEALHDSEPVAERLDAEEDRQRLCAVEGPRDEAAHVGELEALALAVDEQHVTVLGDRPGGDHGVVGHLLLESAAA